MRPEVNQYLRSFKKRYPKPVVMISVAHGRPKRYGVSNVSPLCKALQLCCEARVGSDEHDQKAREVLEHLHGYRPSATDAPAEAFRHDLHLLAAVLRSY
jgi:hypothetical protein